MFPTPTARVRFDKPSRSSHFSCHKNSITRRRHADCRQEQTQLNPVHDFPSWAAVRVSAVVTRGLSLTLIIACKAGVSRDISDRGRSQGNRRKSVRRRISRRRIRHEQSRTAPLRTAHRRVRVRRLRSRARLRQRRPYAPFGSHPPGPVSL